MNDDAPQFSLRSMFIISTVLMVCIALFMQVPLVLLGAFAIPAAISMTVAMPYLLLRLVVLLGDDRERTFRSVELQRVIWALVICLFVSSPVIAFAIGTLRR